MSSLDGGTATGLAFLAILVTWATGIATTAFGAGGIVFYGLGLAELWWRNQRRRKQRVDPR